MFSIPLNFFMAEAQCFILSSRVQIIALNPAKPLKTDKKAEHAT
jgi:hypothetical protein